LAVAVLYALMLQTTSASCTNLVLAPTWQEEQPVGYEHQHIANFMTGRDTAALDAKPWQMWDGLLKAGALFHAHGVVPCCVS
jgi:hypothetical protein